MCWIKTYRGQLCNLALASDIRLEAPMGSETKFKVVAMFPVGGEVSDTTWLASFDTEAEARVYLDELAAILVPRPLVAAKAA